MLGHVRAGGFKRSVPVTGGQAGSTIGEGEALGQGACRLRIGGAASADPARRGGKAGFRPGFRGERVGGVTVLHR